MLSGSSLRRKSFTTSSVDFCQADADEVERSDNYGLFWTLLAVFTESVAETHSQVIGDVNLFDLLPVDHYLSSQSNHNFQVYLESNIATIFNSTVSGHGNIYIYVTLTFIFLEYRMVIIYLTQFCA